MRKFESSYEVQSPTALRNRNLEIANLKDRTHVNQKIKKIKNIPNTKGSFNKFDDPSFDTARQRGERLECVNETPEIIETSPIINRSLEDDKDSIDSEIMKDLQAYRKEQ
jgi:hypothetical protein